MGGCMTITINGTTGISGVDGTAATPAFKGNDSNTGVSFGTDTVTINTGGQARVTTDASGNVGVGTVSPAAKLDVRGNAYFAGNATSRQTAQFANTGGEMFLGLEASSGGAVFVGSSAYASIIGSNNATPLQFGTNGTIRATLDTSGNLGLGVTPSAWDSGYRALQIGSRASFAQGSSDTYIGNNWINDGTNRYIGTAAASIYGQTGGAHIWYNAPSGTAGNAISFTQAMTLDASGRQLIGITGNTAYETNTKSTLFTSGTGQVFNLLQLTNVGTPAEGNIVGIGFAAGETTQYGVKGSIGFVRTDIYGRGALTFYTNNTAGSESVSTANERMRLTSDGNLLVGVTAASGGSRLRVRSAGNTFSTNCIVFENSSASTLFYVRDDGLINTGTASLSPYNNTTGVAANMVVGSDGFLYRSTSSLKYKKEVQDATHGLADVLNLRPVTYKGKSESDGDKVFGGLIAEEVHEAGLTEFVQYADDGSPDALNYGNMVSLAFKAIQEQQALITKLQADVAALKGAA